MTATTASDNTKIIDAARKALVHLSEQKSPSSARFSPISVLGTPQHILGPCYHQIASCLGSHPMLAVCYMGYGGFLKDDRWRPASLDDIATNREYPFVLTDVCHYNSYSLEYLKFLLDPEGPFKAVLPHLLETDPEKVQADRGFIFPDAQNLPPKLTWCFLIASRVGVANARVFWKYFLLKEMGFGSSMAALMAGGFDEELVKAWDGNGYAKTGKIIKNYTAGWLGVDVSAYAKRWLNCDPMEEKPFHLNRVGPGGSAKVWEPEKPDFKTMRFDNWEAAAQYTADRVGFQMEKAA